MATEPNPDNPGGMSDVQIEEMKEAFNLFDEDGDGEITEEDLGNLLSSLGDVATPAQVHDLFMEVDEDGGGSIDFDEFMVMMADRMKERDQEEEPVGRPQNAMERDGHTAVSCGLDAHYRVAVPSSSTARVLCCQGDRGLQGV